MTDREREACVAQPAHPVGQMDVRQVCEVAGIAYFEAGDPGAMPVLFLHGATGGARVFGPQLAHFGRRYRAIAWEMPGYAGSAPLPLVTMAALASTLAGFIAALRLDRPALVGHGIGGMIVQRLLAEAADAARAIVLAQTSAVPQAVNDWWRGRLDAGRSLAEIAPSAILALVGDAPDPAGVALARECLAAVPQSTFRDMVLAAKGFDMSEALGRIAAPTLVLAGRRDRITPPEEAERLADGIPGARLVVLEGAGHLAHAERPAAFNAAVEAFLREAVY